MARARSGIQPVLRAPISALGSLARNGEEKLPLVTNSIL
jgi:hypothetical protein